MCSEGSGNEYSSFLGGCSFGCRFVHAGRLSALAAAVDPGVATEWSQFILIRLSCSCAAGEAAQPPRTSSTEQPIDPVLRYAVTKLLRAPAARSWIDPLTRLHRRRVQAACSSGLGKA